MVPEPVPISSTTAALRSGREALARGAWDEAAARFAAALAREESAEAHEGLATAAYYLEDIDGVFAAHERAHALYRERGDRAAAARMAIQLVIDVMDYRPDSAVANGWLQKAARLLDEAPLAPEHGMLACLRGHQALMGFHDVAAARRYAAEALEVAHATGDQDVEMMALALDGLAAVNEGDVSRGMGLLDEATATALSGEARDPNLTSTACCYLIHACDSVRDFGRAREWCLRVRRFCEKWRFTAMFTICRTQYASVLTAQGQWEEAERELLAALADFEANREGLAGSALVRLAELRRRQGRHGECEALLARAPSHRLTPLVRGGLALDCGELLAAREEAERCLRRIALGDRTERIAALELLVRAAVARGDGAVAGEALEELAATAALVGTDALRAAHLAAAGWVAAASDPAAAEHLLEDAALAYAKAGMPWDAARTQQRLAEVLRARGRVDAAQIVERQVREAMAALGVAPGTPATTPIEGRKASRESPVPAAAGVLSAREVEVLSLVAQGLADKGVADRLFLSPHTVHRHVSNILTKLDAPSRAAAVAMATKLGLLG